jgi:hypothetical protein
MRSQVTRPGMSARALRAVLLLAITALALSAPGAFAERTAPLTIWQVQPTFNPEAEAVTDSLFSGVSASAPTQAWAAGYFSDENALDHALVERWSGSEWTDVIVPEPPEEQVQLKAVDDLGADDAWVVGLRFPGGIDSNPADSSRTLIEHWNGSVWSIVPSPNPAVGSGDSDTLNAIGGSGPDDLWAAGDALNQENGSIELVFEHWNGQEWSLAQSPTPPGGAQFAAGVVAVGPGDVWAVGTEAGAITNETLSAHWNGREWSIVPTPEFIGPGDVQNQLTAVTAAGADEVWASGYAYNVRDENRLLPYVLSWNGKSWTMTKVPKKGGEGSRLNGIQALSPDDVWAVGQIQQDNGTIKTLTEQFDGSTWRIVKSPDPGRSGNDSLDAVTASGATSLLAVGAQEIKGQCCLRTLAIGTGEA